MAEQHRKLVRLVAEDAWTQGRLEALDEAMARTAIVHDATFPGGQTDLAGYGEYVRMSRAAFPDVRLSVEDQLIDGDRTAVRLSATGTHRGELWGISPTGKIVSAAAI